MHERNLNKTILLLILTFFILTISACKDDPTFYQSAEEYTPPTSVRSYSTPPADTSFKFGVMGDTQWYNSLTDPEFRNPETVAGSFITQINDEMISHGVEFVIQVGDLTNYGYDDAIKARAALSKDLYDAGIGFYPMRGNHEPLGGAFAFSDADGDGTIETSPWVSDDWVDNDLAIPQIQASFPQTQGLPMVFNEDTDDEYEEDYTGGATNFSSPTNDAYPNMATELAGISYAFDYDDGTGNSATFVIFDPWETDTQDTPLFYKNYGFMYPYPYGYPVSSQQAWISERIDSTTRGTDHAFVFSHQPLIASDHEDSPFGYLAFDPTDMTDEGDGDVIVGVPDNTDDQNTFYADLVANDVAFYISGHDHMHDRTVVESPDGLSKIDQLIVAPACNKFYHPQYDAAEWRGQKTRRTVIDTEYDNTGYYIFTVDGPIVKVDYYADAVGGLESSDLYTPEFNFVLKNSWTYSLNGDAFTVAQGASFSTVTNTYAGTTMTLGGTNTSTTVEDPEDETGGDEMPLSKRITVAWKDMAQYSDTKVVSNALILNGMKESRTGNMQKYILTMSATGLTPSLSDRIVKLGSDGGWSYAGSNYTSGAADISYAVGTFGISGSNIWTVVEGDGIFAIYRD